MTATVAEKKEVLTPKLGNLKLLLASEVKQAWGLNILIYGKPGVGKTTLCATAQDSPYGRNVLYVDLEGGTMSISDREDIAIFRPTKWEDLRELHKALLDGVDAPYQTVVVDSLTEVQTMALKSITTADQITQQQWGLTNNRVLDFVRAMRGLTHSKGINTFFTALVREQKDEQTGAVTVGPALTPGAALNVEAAVDSMGYLTWNPKTGKRILHLDGDGKFTAKVRQPMSNKRIPRAMEDPSMVAILEALRGGEAVEQG